MMKRTAGAAQLTKRNPIVASRVSAAAGGTLTTTLVKMSAQGVTPMLLAPRTMTEAGRTPRSVELVENDVGRTEREKKFLLFFFDSSSSSFFCFRRFTRCLSIGFYNCWVAMTIAPLFFFFLVCVDLQPPHLLQNRNFFFFFFRTFGEAFCLFSFLVRLAGQKETCVCVCVLANRSRWRPNAPDEK